MGVGIGEATASPTAYSLISDYFPKRQRATALAIYSSGLYLGGGVSLFIGALIVKAWNEAYPGGGPLGLVGWQAAFLAVGIPGLLVALWVATLREPVRGAMDGLPTPGSPTPFRTFADRPVDASFRRSRCIGAGSAAGRRWRSTWPWPPRIDRARLAMIGLTGNLPQWSAVGLGYYAVFSWAARCAARDPATFRLIWGTPAFLCTSSATAWSRSPPMRWLSGPRPMPRPC